MIFPASRFEPLVTISPYSLESIGGNMLTNIMSNAVSATWPVANQALFYPFYVSKTVTIQQLFLLNGATATGNVDMGIYSAGFTKIVSSGSQAQTSTNVIQSCPIAATQLSAGYYYLAIAMSSTSSTVFRVNNYNSVYAKTMGCAQMNSAFPLPATATPASYNTAIVPVIALSTRSVI
jgi:hypothetical protein